jgi:stage II sporulation protein M
MNSTGGHILFTRIKGIIGSHIAKNRSSYFFLLLAFILGVSAGAFTVNGLSTAQRDELLNYFQGFLQLLNNQSMDGSELLSVSLIENMKLVLVMWVLGVSIIGIPFIYMLVAVRGFITGFSSGFIINAIGMKGVLFTLFALLPKEIVIVPCLIALGVNGINFSLKIIRNRSSKTLLKEGLKENLLSYCFVTLFFSCFIFAGVLLEAYITPVFMRMVAPMITAVK